MKRTLFFMLLLNCFLNAEEKIPTYIDPPTEKYFKDWLLCGPFPNPLPKGIKEYQHDETSLGFYIDYLQSAGGENNIQPYVGMELKHPDGKLMKWKKYHGYFSLIPLDEFFSPNTQTIAYAACIIRCSRGRTVIMSVTSNDGVRVWQNGQLILDHNTGGTEEPDRDLVPVVLHKGDNLFLIKISQGFGKWSFQFRFLNLIKTVQDFEERAYLFSRPEITETKEKWQFFIGQRYKTELLSSDIPVGLEIRNNNGEDIEAAYDAYLGQSLSINKKELNLNPGLHRVYCKTFTPDGTPHILRSSIYVSEPPSIKKSYQFFKDIPRIDSTTFLGEQLNNIYHCMNSHLQDDVKRGNSQPLDKWTQRNVVKRYHKYLDEIKTKQSPYHEVFPQIRSIQLTENGVFDITSNNTLNDRTEGKCKADIDLLLKSLLKPNVKLLKKKSSKAAIKIGFAKDMIKDLNGIFLPHEEAYAILIQPDYLKVIGASASGIHNGLISLRQIINLSTKLPSVTIFDYPANRHRSAFTYWQLPLDEKSKSNLFKFIDLKYNEIVVATGKYRELENLQVQKGLLEYFEYLRSFHVEPIPTVWLNGDKSWYEGIFLKDEPVAFVNNKASFGFQRLVDLANSEPIVHSKIGGGQFYQRNKDYQIISAEPPVISRMVDGKIPEDEIVFLDADIVDRRTHRFFKPCVSEEAVYKKFEKNIKNTIELLHPKKIHVNHDELGILNSDSRCLQRSKKDYELVAEQINRMREIIKKYDPNVEMIMWADAVNPYHNAGKKNLEKVCDLLEKDIIMAHWYYTAENFEQVDLVELGSKFFLEKGFRMYGSPWDHMVNHQVWEEVSKVNCDDSNFLGLMHTQWGGRNNGLSQTAAINWSGKTWLTK
jgi:hypothetical protein